jgi:hypothetical protein
MGEKLLAKSASENKKPESIESCHQRKARRRHQRAALRRKRKRLKTSAEIGINGENNGEMVAIMWRK